METSTSVSRERQEYRASNANATLNVDLDFESLTHLTGGRHGKHDTLCPNCSASCKSAFNKKRRVLRIWQQDDDFVTYNCQRCGTRGHARRSRAAGNAPIRPVRRVLRQATTVDDDVQRRTELALGIWRSTVPIKGTPAETYLRSRSLVWDGGLDHVLRFHSDLFYDGRSVAGVVGLFRDILTDEPCGIQRIFLDRHARKIERRMLGRSKGAAIKLDAHEDVTLGLHTGEGIETCLAARQLGYRPTWALGSANAIADFPVLTGIEAISVLVENDDASRGSAEACIDRYLDADCEAWICEPTNGDMNDAVKLTEVVS